MLLGVDVGGTFTDAVLAAPGRIATAKAPTTPDDQSRGVMAAVEAVLGRAGAAPCDVRAMAHGMTVATNALLEGEHARTAFVATEGFTDIVELARQSRAELYRLCAARPAPIAGPELRFPAPERIGARGVLRALSSEGAARLADAVASASPEAVAVCLLHSWRDPAHERALGSALRKRLGERVHVSLSHEVVGTFREYERAATTEVDAALSPLLAGYLERLLERTRAAGLPDPRIMQSSGGLIDARVAAGHAVLTVLSGPAGGAAAAALLARACGEPNLLCFDMGGTSCDVSVVEDGRVRERAAREIAGRPVALPAVDIHTVGAGGGSIAWRDAGGALRVGPRSAGAVPGPAAYGAGGLEPTVTDAHVVLGTLDPGHPLAGGVRLDGAAASAAVERLASELALSTGECAEGILRVANAEMVRALRVMSVERGLDPRGFALLAFGGAGPLHAAAIAEELGVERILVPRASGVLSALGLAAADRRATHQRSVFLDARKARAGDELGSLRAELLRQAQATLGVGASPAEAAFDVRYRGQSHELAVRESGEVLGAAQIAERFEDEHERRYGWREPQTPVEIVNVRLSAIDPGPPVDLTGAADEPAGAVTGPAVLRLEDTTVAVPPGWSGAPDRSGTLILERRS